MFATRKFTINDVLRANQRLIERKPIDISKLSPVSQEIIRNFTVSAEEINRAFAKTQGNIKTP